MVIFETSDMFELCTIYMQYGVYHSYSHAHNIKMELLCFYIIQLEMNGKGRFLPGRSMKRLAEFPAEGRESWSTF